ncbi:MAG: hypothetical protein DSM106950_05020 [Stigonema ocellatum SAG 48.90 = DSM 106950]|nr:hypothetical protein [Stigonema ocellatum SAG 48.90 = DSM 106950]
MMHKKNPHNGLILWEKWVLATTLGEVLGLSILALASTAFHGMVGEIKTDAILLLIGTLQGVVLGFFQW